MARPMTTNAPDAIPADPCPFCGSQPIVTECRDTADGFVHDYAVRCNECGINIVEEYRDDAVASWNRRAPRAPLAAPVAEVRARYSGEDDFGERDVSWLVKPSDLPSGTKLYSAIPAPGTALSGTAEGWKPIETAPNGKSILLHYDDGEFCVLEECDNDDEWLPYPGKQRFCSRPTHWMPLPAAPTPPSADSAQDDDLHRFAVVSSDYAHPFLLGAYPKLENAIKAQCGSPEKWHIFERYAANKGRTTDGNS